MNLTDSVRQWVLASLPYDRGDAKVVAYLNGLDAHAALVVYYKSAGRLVPPQPRTVHKSRAFEQNPLTSQRASDLALIIADIEQGRNLKKYLSRDIDRAAVKVPGDKRRDLDMLLNDWGIRHLHISSVVEANGFVKRDDHLLLVSFKPDAAYLIDVMSHRDMTYHKWVRHHLLEALASEWPHEGVIYEMKTPTAPNQLTETQRANFRGNHYNAAFSFGGRTFVPRGLTMAIGTTMEARLYARHLLDRVREVEKALTENPCGCAAVFERYNSTLPNEPEFVFGIGNDGPAILEKKTGTWIALRETPRRLNSPHMVVM
jgi:hypothetical protein